MDNYQKIPFRCPRIPDFPGMAELFFSLCPKVQNLPCYSSIFHRLRNKIGHCNYQKLLMPKQGAYVSPDHFFHPSNSFLLFAICRKIAQKYRKTSIFNCITGILHCPFRYIQVTSSSMPEKVQFFRHGEGQFSYIPKSNLFIE